MPWRILPAALVFVTMLAGCGDDATTGTAADGSRTPSSESTRFCEAWNAALASGEDSMLDQVLASAPPELSDAAAVLRQARPGGDERSRAEAEILEWTELHCERRQSGQSERHIAPPSDAKFDGLTFCGTTAFARSPADDRSGMVLYGATSVGDPYDGPMLGVFWNGTDDGGHGGDGDSRPVTVRGHTGVAAPITVFQQVVLPELGTVIAWSEGGRALGFYARLWPIERRDELVAIANQLEADDGGFRIPDGALPRGYAEVFSGHPSVTSIVLAPSLYSLRYEGNDGLLDVHGLQMSEEEFEAFRFFTMGVDQDEVAGRPALAGNAWDKEGGPSVVTWRESDGLVVRIVGIGVSLVTAREVADRSRELTEEEWAALVRANTGCDRE
ncbi:MAG TPA: hypothetical protein VG455_07715 [Acidimicrobiales bacterium]|nr:hypothetical protein [Acidimicrobiales bacterium]